MADITQAEGHPSRAERALRGYLLGTVPEEQRTELDDVARHVCALIPQAAGTELLVARGDAVETLAVSDRPGRRAAELRDEHQVAGADLLGAGPVRDTDLPGDRRWAGFLADLRTGTGLTSFVSLPVTPVEQFRVALVVYAEGADPLAGAEAGRVRLAACLGKNLIHSLVLRDQVANLEVALDSNRRIGVAVGIVMTRSGLTQPAAFKILQKVSQHHNVKLRDLAEQIVLTGDVPDPTGAQDEK